MNSKSFVRLSNIIGIISIILLIYWVFVYVSIEVFDLKVFRENMTQTFYMSIFGILALMFGALIINIMFNLSRIAEKHNQDETQIPSKFAKSFRLAFILSFPIIFGLLYTGDYLTSKKKELFLIKTAISIIENNKEKTAKLLNYSFDKEWIKETRENLSFISQFDKNFPNIMVVVNDSVEKTKVFLGFDNYSYYSYNDTTPPLKKDYIIETTQPERDYLKKVFDQSYNEVRFSAHDGKYELYFPYFKDNKKIVLYFSDYQRYGKIGK